MKTVRGATAEQRAAVRKVVRGQRRLAFFTDKIRNARDGTERIQQACYYVQAVGVDLDEAARNKLAKAVAEIADRWNPR